MDNITHEEVNAVKVYSSYTPAQKKATLKYREQNKEKINTQRKEYYKKKVSEDPAFLEYKRKKAKEYYDRKKLLKGKLPEPVKATPPEPVPEPVPEVVEVKPEAPEPVVEPVKKVKVKKGKVVEPVVDVIKEEVLKVDLPPVVEEVKTKPKTKVKKV